MDQKAVRAPARVLALALSLMVGGCSSSDQGLKPYSVRTHAPTQRSDTGIALQIRNLSPGQLYERLARLAQVYPEMSVRSLPPSGELIEVFSVPALQIARMFPESVPVPNSYHVAQFKKADLAKQQVSSTCVLPDRAIKVSTAEPQELVTQGITLTLSGATEVGRTFFLNLDVSSLPDLRLEPGSTRWEIFHVSTERLISRVRGFSANAQLVDPGEYFIRISATEAGSKRICLARSLRFALRSKEELATPGSVSVLPNVERLGAVFPHLVSIEAISARTKTDQGKGVSVAIIDTGVQYNHPDLHARISSTRRGWNFVEGDEFPFDSSGHGTLVAGLVAGANYGVAPLAEILPLRVINAFGGSDTLSVAAAIRYASTQGARIINLSLGTEEARAAILFEEAIRFATEQGSLVVAASGNGAIDGSGLNLETYPLYPAALEIPGLLTVLATDLLGERTPYTHYSATKVALGAPGGTDQDGGLSSTQAYASLGRLGKISGSSASAPLVSGAAALIWSSAPSLSNLEVQRILEISGTKAPSLSGTTRSGALLNAYSAALKLAAPIE
jgi:hypothetical protein